MSGARERLTERLASADRCNSRVKCLTNIAVEVEDLRSLLSERRVEREEIARIIDPEAFGDMSLRKVVLMSGRQITALRKADAILSLLNGEDHG